MDEHLPEAYKYIAFISYSNRDHMAAARLKKRLRQFRMPAFMREQTKQNGLSVFMADKDFNENTVLAGLHKKLDESKYLILVCSPHSAKSPWCNDEVSYFIQTGRCHQIIPYIIDGHPNAEHPKRECFPPPLKDLPAEEQLSGIDTRRVGRYNGYLMAVSRMLGIEYESVRVEDWKRRRTTGSLAAAALAVILLVAVHLVYYFTPHFKYYADYVDCNGIPEGILPVDKQTRQHRAATYRFEWRKGKLVRTTLVNAYGHPREHLESERMDRPCIREISYGNDGGLEITNKNAFGQILWMERVSRDRRLVDLKSYNSEQGTAIQRSLSDLEDMQGAHAFSFDLSHINKLSKSTIRCYELIRDSSGYITQRLFGSTNGNTGPPGHDANGIEGLRYELDPLHRILSETYIDAHGNIHPDHNGVASRHHFYDEYGNLTREEFRNGKGQYTLNEHFWAIAEANYNEYGEPVDQHYYSDEGQPCCDRYGVSICKFIWDDKGNLIETAYFDEKGKPVNFLPNDRGLPVSHRLRWKHDSEGRVSELRCFDLKDSLITTGDLACFAFKYDRDGFLTEASGRDAHGNPAYGFDGTAITSYEYHSGNCTSVSTYDRDNKAMNNLAGYHWVLRVYDDYNRVVSEEYFDKYGHRASNPKLGHATGIKVRYDPKSGNIDRLSYLGPDGKPAPNRNGMVIIDYLYNDQGLCVEESNTSTDGILYWRLRFEYDERGNQTAMHYINHADTLAILESTGCASYLWRYNENGQLSEIQSLDTKHKHIINQEGWSLAKYQYEKNNPLPVSMSFHDENGQPVIPERQGCHEIRNRYGRGRPVEISWHGLNGELMENPRYGACRQTQLYSQFGLPTVLTYYGLDGKPCDGKDGFSRCIQSYSPQGQLISQSFWDAHHRRVICHSAGYHSVRYKKLPNGLTYKSAFYGPDSSPMDGPGGYHSLEMFYDSHFNPYKYEYRDKDGNLVIPKDRLHSVAEWIQDDSTGQIVYRAESWNENPLFATKTIALQTPGYPPYVTILASGKYTFSDGTDTVDFEVRDKAALDSLIKAKETAYKEEYSAREGVTFLF